MSREYFTAVGKLYPCPNPSHPFTIGKIVGTWGWAKKSWGHLNEAGNLVTTWFGVLKIETPSGLSYHKIVVWKFVLLLAKRR